jgi:alpha-amylase
VKSASSGSISENKMTSSKKENRLTIFPNPVKAGEQIKVSGIFEGKVQIQLFDKMGRVVYNKNKFPNSETDLRITCPSLKTGDYIIKISDSEKSRSQFLSVR